MPSKASKVLPVAPDYERSLKARFLQHCVDKGGVGSDWCLSSEYRLDGNARRADLAILGPERFVGIEFKSSRDTVKRLSAQIDAYLRVFDDVVLVVAEKHVVQALDQTPLAVTVYIAENDGSLTLVRQATIETGAALCNRTMSQSLTKTQLSELVANVNPHLSRNQLMTLVDVLPTDKVRSAVQSAFLSRYGATSKQFWRRTAGKTIKIEHLESLSRYAKRRKIWEQHKNQSEKFWANWSKEADLHFGRDNQSSQSSSVSYFSSGLS